MVKICDFGLSSFESASQVEGIPMARTKPSQTVVVMATTTYSAPELKSSVHSKKVDVYSFAIMCVRLKVVLNFLFNFCISPAYGNWIVGKHPGKN